MYTVVERSQESRAWYGVLKGLPVCFEIPFFVPLPFLYLFLLSLAIHYLHTIPDRDGHWNGLSSNSNLLVSQFIGSAIYGRNPLISASPIFDTACEE
jgi:hypothetical protein